MCGDGRPRNERPAQRVEQRAMIGQTVPEGDFMESKRNYERTLYASEKNGIERGGSVETADRRRMAARGCRRGVDEDHIGQHHREAADTRLKGR